MGSQYSKTQPQKESLLNPTFLTPTQAARLGPSRLRTQKHQLNLNFGR